MESTKIICKLLDLVPLEDIFSINSDFRLKVFTRKTFDRKEKRSQALIVLFLFKYKTFNQLHSERVKKIQLLTRKLDIRNMTIQINIV